EAAIQALTQEPCELLIIKSDILLHQDDRKKWTESIKREKESGVIILPPYFEPLLVPNDIEINIEQEPCTDLCVEQLPPVTPQKSGKWIPVSERLPEKYGEYLITWTGVCGKQRSKPLIGIAEYEIYEPENYEDWITTDNEFRHYHDIKVLAWQELPEPYKTQESENKE
ncbi:MAG: DUF551 domain-containing protein, partial [Lachnospiraceae bacterium]|nr:DUF551 domain-containing protein [Lachnospiraceae bacterium]